MWATNPLSADSRGSSTNVSGRPIRGRTPGAGRSARISATGVKAQRPSILTSGRLRRSTERATRAAFLGVTGGASRVRALRQSVIAAESAVEAKREGYEAGINTNLEVLDAQRDLFLSSTDLLRARYDFILNILRLKQAAGTLNEEDVERFNRWLQ